MPPTILVFCPDMNLKSAGLRLLYRHVAVLTGSGFRARILHQRSGFHLSDAPDVPTTSLHDADCLSPGDIVVLPEGCTAVAPELRRRQNIKLLVIALSWRYIFPSMPPVVNWRFLGVEHAITNSSVIRGLVEWSMRVPTHLFTWGVRPDLYYAPRQKQRMVMYIERKQEDAAMLRRVLMSRNPRLVQQIEWRAIDGLTEVEYAAVVRDSAVFLNLSTGEGLPCSMVEAMRTGALVAGYTGIGGRQVLVGSGEHQNSLLAENGDYYGLAQALEPALVDLANGDMTRWEPIIQNGVRASAPFTPEAEHDSIVKLWQQLLTRDGLA